MPTRLSATFVINLLDEENEPEQAGEQEWQRATEQEQPCATEQKLQHTVHERAHLYRRLCRHALCRTEQERPYATAQEQESAATQELRCASLNERACASILAQPLDRPLHLAPVRSPIPRQEWVAAISAIIAPDADRAVARVYGTHDANVLVARLGDLLGPQVTPATK